MNDPHVPDPSSPPAPDASALISRLRRTPHLTPAEFDALPFGAIKVDREGTVLAYNVSEARLANRKPERVIGKNFFTEVAPCTNVETFGETFRQGMAKGRFNITFPFVFPFPSGTVNVWVTLYHEATDEFAWIFVEQRQRPNG
jgi:photoactive yellow protein